MICTTCKFSDIHVTVTVVVSMERPDKSEEIQVTRFEVLHNLSYDQNI